MQSVGRRHAVPVVAAYAARLVGRRFPQLGEATVGVHPTTAQGFTFGMLGRYPLTRGLRAAVAAGRDVADLSALARYPAAHGAEKCLFFAGGGRFNTAVCGRGQPARSLAAELGAAAG